MPNTPHPQAPLWVEASPSRRTNLHIDYKETIDAAKQRRPESDLRRPPVRCRNIRHINASVVPVGGALCFCLTGQTGASDE